VGQAVTADKTASSRTVARKRATKINRQGWFRSSNNPEEERTLDHAQDAASFLAGHPSRYGERSTESTSGPGQAFGDVVKRGKHVMGFSHEATTHHFRLFKDGGGIAVTA
jgi:hypothetical protein